MTILQTIIVTILATLFGLIFDMNSETDQALLADQFQQLLFAEEEIERDGVWVSRVVDGDTIVVTENGEEKKVRLIGVDTPETVDPRKPVECFGKEASDKTTEYLLGKAVVLEPDLSQGDVDKYGRLLRYVFLENGFHVNLALIADGYAYEYTYDLPYKYQADFKEAEKGAKERRLGLWGDSCNFSENE